MKSQQTTLSEPKITTKWPKRHRLTKKKFFQKDYDVKAEDFDGIILKAEELGITEFVVGYSGGKDSGKVLDKLLDSGKNVKVLHLDTKIGLKSTQDFVIDQCNDYGVKLDIRSPTPLEEAYVAYCLQFGFPGPFMHSAIMKILKYNTMKKYIQEKQFKNKQPAIIGGVRKLESVRRFGNYNSPITQETDLWFVNPIFYESDGAVWEYFNRKKLKRAPAYKTLGFSGECMCASFATKGEAQILKKIDLKLFEKIEWITEGIKKYGSKEAKKYAKWGETQDFDDVRNQQILENFFDEDEIKHLDKMAVNACGSECGPGTLNGMMNY